jgi:hypothetical protein
MQKNVVEARSESIERLADVGVRRARGDVLAAAGGEHVRRDRISGVRGEPSPEHVGSFLVRTDGIQRMAKLMMGSRMTRIERAGLTIGIDRRADHAAITQCVAQIEVGIRESRGALDSPLQGRDGVGRLAARPQHDAEIVPRLGMAVVHGQSLPVRGFRVLGSLRFLVEVSEIAPRVHVRRVRHECTLDVLDALVATTLLKAGDAQEVEGSRALRHGLEDRAIDLFRFACLTCLVQVHGLQQCRLRRDSVANAVGPAPCRSPGSAIVHDNTCASMITFRLSLMQNCVTIPGPVPPPATVAVRGRRYRQGGHDG